jgi:hypothetical protein
LGRLIVEQLGIGETTDTLSRWMAHRLAELITIAESDPDARSQATDLILRLWEHRARWPSWPPPAMARTLRWLDDNRTTRRLEHMHDSPWAEQLASVERSLSREFQTWLFLAIADDEVISELLLDDEREFFERVRHAATQDEVEYIRLLADYRRGPLIPAFISTLTSDSRTEEMIDLARRELKQENLARSQIFESAYERLTTSSSADDTESENETEG